VDFVKNSFQMKHLGCDMKVLYEMTAVLRTIRWAWTGSAVVNSITVR
jgi:hypothetical protein